MSLSIAPWITKLANVVGYGPIGFLVGAAFFWSLLRLVSLPSAIRPKQRIR